MINMFFERLIMYKKSFIRKEGPICILVILSKNGEKIEKDIK